MIDNAAIDRLFRQFDRPDTPGFAVVISHEGKPVFFRSYGCANLTTGEPITPDTVFHVASVSKQFTAMAVTLLEEDGLLSVSDSIRKYLPSLPEFMQNVTLSHLLHHTGGLREQWDLFELSDNCMEDLASSEHVLRLLEHQQERNFMPGDRYTYCNSGYTLLAMTVKAITGKSIRQFTEERIFRPLGMENSFFRDNHAELNPGRAHSYREAAGRNGAGSFPKAFEEPAMTFDLVGSTSLNTTARDLSLWLAEWRAAGCHKIGNDAVFSRMTEPVILNNGNASNYHRGVKTYSYRGLPIREHTGANAGYRALVMAAGPWDIALLSNYRDGNVILKGYALVDILLGYDPDVFAPALEYRDEPQSPVEGRYLGSFGTMSVRTDGKDIIADGKRYRPFGGNSFFCEETRCRIYVSGDTLFYYSGLTPSQWSLFKPSAITPAQQRAISGLWYSEELRTVYEVSASAEEVSLFTLKNGTAVFHQARENYFMRTDKPNTILEWIDGNLFLSQDRSTRIRLVRGHWQAD